MLQRLTDFMTNNQEVGEYAKTTGKVSLIAAVVMILVLAIILAFFHRKLEQKRLSLTVCHALKIMIPLTSVFAAICLAVWPEEMIPDTRVSKTLIAVMGFFSYLPFFAWQQWYL